MVDLINTKVAIQTMIQHGIKATLPTIISWIKKYQFGKKIGGRWYLDEAKFIEFLKGNRKVERSASKKKKAAP